MKKCDCGEPISPHVDQCVRCVDDVIKDKQIFALRAENERLKSESLAEGLPASWWMNAARTQAAEHDADKARLEAEIERLTRERDVLKLALTEESGFTKKSEAERDQLREQLAAARELIEPIATCEPIDADPIHKRIRYVEVQINRTEMAAMKAWLAAMKGPTNG